jgi:UPF0148 protein
MLSGRAKDNMRLAAEFVSRGATMMSEPCPKCGGIQIRYKGRVYCTNHDDLSAISASVEVSLDSVVAQMREVLLTKLNDAARALGEEKDHARQEEIVSLMARCFDLLQKLPQK